MRRIEKKQKMRRTGHNPRRTGQRGENGGEINHGDHGGHGVENEILQQMEVGSKQGKVFVSA
jgi:hypothetical protein